MTKQREIGDPLEHVALTGKLGGSNRQTVRSLEVSNSGRKQKTVYLPSDLARWLNVQAAQEEREISEIVADALEMYRKLH